MLYVPLALLAGMSVPTLWRSLAARPRLRTTFAVALFLFLVPENGFRYAGYVADRHAPVLSDSEVALYAWIRDHTERDAIFLDSNDRVDILLRGPRRQYWGKEAYAMQWGYNLEEMNRRRAVRDAVYDIAARPYPVEPVLDLLRLDAPAYVVVRESDVPGGGGLLSHSENLTGVFSTGDIRVFRVTEFAP